MSEVKQTSTQSALDSRPRVDIYQNIHKALRACMCDTLVRVGALDGADAQDVAAAIKQVRELVEFCRSHLSHENEFVHTAMEARRPGSSTAIADEHAHHLAACERISALAGLVEQTSGAERTARTEDLYRYLALFAAENMVHMNLEETENNMVLWATHSDAELIALEQAIVASLSPQEKAFDMRWVIPALPADERTQLLLAIRPGMPAAAFDGILQIVQPHLGARDWDKLTNALQSAALKAA